MKEKTLFDNTVNAETERTISQIEINDIEADTIFRQQYVGRAKTKDLSYI